MAIEKVNFVPAEPFLSVLPYVLDHYPIDLKYVDSLPKEQMTKFQASYWRSAHFYLKCQGVF